MPSRFPRQVRQSRAAPPEHARRRVNLLDFVNNLKKGGLFLSIANFGADPAANGACVFKNFLLKSDGEDLSELEAATPNIAAADPPPSTAAHAKSAPPRPPPTLRPRGEADDVEHRNLIRCRPSPRSGRATRQSRCILELLID